MRIVDRKTFLSLPSNTVYSVSSWNEEMPSTSITDLFIKGLTVGNIDYYEQAIPDFDYEDVDGKLDAIEESVKSGKSIKIDLYVEQRNAMFDEHQMYALWEKEDIEILIERLKQCL